MKSIFCGTFVKEKEKKGVENLPRRNPRGEKKRGQAYWRQLLQILLPVTCSQLKKKTGFVQASDVKT